MERSYKTESIAQRIFCLGGTQQEIEELLDTNGFEFRKGKGMEDIKKARVKACNPKNTFCKTEFEIRMFEVYLRTDIIKQKRKTKESKLYQVLSNGDLKLKNKTYVHGEEKDTTQFVIFNTKAEYITTIKIYDTLGVSSDVLDKLELDLKDVGLRMHCYNAFETLGITYERLKKDKDLLKKVLCHLKYNIIDGKIV